MTADDEAEQVPMVGVDSNATAARDEHGYKEKKTS